MRAINWDSAAAMVFLAGMVTALLLKSCDTFNYQECIKQNRAGCETIVR